MDGQEGQRRSMDHACERRNIVHQVKADKLRHLGQVILYVIRDWQLRSPSWQVK